MIIYNLIYDIASTWLQTEPPAVDGFNLKLADFLCVHFIRPWATDKPRLIISLNGDVSSLR